jgi:DNA excision repair protein ERCC-2
MITFANVVIYNYQYMLDPKVAGVISRELEKECVVVFDEAHNIDNVCIEALSVNLRQQTLDGAQRNLTKLGQVVEK